MKKKVNRKDFLKIVGVSAATVTAATTIGCATKNSSKEATAAGELVVPKGKMEKKKIPGIDPNVGLLAYGCMRWPLLENPEPGTCIVDQEAVNDLVDYSLEHGINYYDTAPVYMQGWSEEVMGKALSRHPRDSYFIATKMSNQSLRDPSFENSVAMYYNSLEKLQTDYIDFYLLHTVGRSMENFNKRFIDNGLLDFLLKEREAGRIRKLGWSFHGVKDAFDGILALHDKYNWDFVMIQLNYVDWRHASGDNVNADYLYAELRKKDIPMAIMEPLQGGRLSRMPEYIINRLYERDPSRTPASWAFRYAGSMPGVFTVLSGMAYLEHVQENITTYSPLEYLTEEENNFLTQTGDLLIEYPTVPCNDCKYCMPCPYAIDIPAILLHYNKCVIEGNIPSNKLDPNYAEARRAFLVGYDRSVPKLRQAERCISCNQCIEDRHCPQFIDIPKELMRIADYVNELKASDFA